MVPPQLLPLLALLGLGRCVAVGNEGVSCPGGCVCRRPGDCFSVDQPLALPPSCCLSGLVCCPPTGISNRKCEEYAGLAYRDGRPGCRMLALPLIVGGDQVDPGQVPHAALLGYGDGKSSVSGVAWLCGGALVSERWVLTAAHCVHGQRGLVRWVRLGTWLNGHAEDDNAQELAVGRRVVHPGYRPPARYHDVALLLLERPASLGPNVRPACLHTHFDIAAPKAQACGYGRVQFDEDNTGDALRCVWLPLLRRVDCARFYKEDMGKATLPQGMPRSMLCAADLAGGKDTCQGDSGGPLHLVLREPSCMHALIGITAFGKFCGFRSSPGVYMRVSHYVPWIESVVWAEDVQWVRAANAREEDLSPVGDWEASVIEEFYDWVGMFG